MSIFEFDDARPFFDTKLAFLDRLLALGEERSNNWHIAAERPSNI